MKDILYYGDNGSQEFFENEDHTIVIFRNYTESQWWATKNKNGAVERWICSGELSDVFSKTKMEFVGIGVSFEMAWTKSGNIASFDEAIEIDGSFMFMAKTFESLKNANKTDINTMSVEEIMGHLAQRAYDAGAVDSRSQLCLLALKDMGNSAKDSFGHNLEDTDEVFGSIEDFNEDMFCGNADDLEYLKKASEFGISYVNGY